MRKNEIIIFFIILVFLKVAGFSQSDKINIKDITGIVNIIKSDSIASEIKAHKNMYLEPGDRISTTFASSAELDFNNNILLLNPQSSLSLTKTKNTNKIQPVLWHGNILLNINKNSSVFLFSAYSILIESGYGEIFVQINQNKNILVKVFQGTAKLTNTSLKQNNIIILNKNEQIILEKKNPFSQPKNTVKKNIIAIKNNNTFSNTIQDTSEINKLILLQKPDYFFTGLSLDKNQKYSEEEKKYFRRPYIAIKGKVVNPKMVNSIRINNISVFINSNHIFKIIIPAVNGKNKIKIDIESTDGSTITAQSRTIYRDLNPPDVKNLMIRSQYYITAAGIWIDGTRQFLLSGPLEKYSKLYIKFNNQTKILDSDGYVLWSNRFLEDKWITLQYHAEDIFGNISENVIKTFYCDLFPPRIDKIKEQKFTNAGKNILIRSNEPLKSIIINSTYTITTLTSDKRTDGYYYQFIIPEKFLKQNSKTVVTARDYSNKLSSGLFY